jgi:hypothetical protein
MNMKALATISLLLGASVLVIVLPRRVWLPQDD